MWTSLLAGFLPDVMANSRSLFLHMVSKNEKMRLDGKVKFVALIEVGIYQIRHFWPFLL